MQESLTQQLLQYGTLGVFAIIMLWVIWYLEKQRTAREADLLSRVAKLEQKLDDQQKEHDDFLRNEFAKSNEVNDKCLQVLDEVRGLLISKKIS